MNYKKCINEAMKLIPVKKEEKPNVADKIANAVIIAEAVALLPHTIRINKGKGFSIQSLTWKVDFNRTPYVEDDPAQGYRYTVTFEPFPALIPAKEV